MHTDLAEAARPARRHPLGTAGRLRAALLALAGGHGAVTRHAEKPWASVTFQGARHTLDLAFDGADAVAAAELFIAALPEHEFAIPRQLVAEANVISVDHRLVPEPHLALTCELLLLEDS